MNPTPLRTRSGHGIPLRALARVTLIGGALMLGGCTAMQAQNPGSALSPVNAVALDGERRLMLSGHDVVAYFVQGGPLRGLPQFRSEVDGVGFHFASASNKALFDAAPERYLPQYGGYCANGIAYGIPWGGDADSWRIIDGKLYIFGGAGSRDGFDLDTAGNLKLADHYWKTEVAGRNSFWQRGKRLVLRVPHYKSGAEIAHAVALARSGSTPAQKP